MRRTVHLFMLLLLMLGLPMQATAQDGTPEASPAAESADLLAALGYPTLSFTATDSETLELPEGEIAAGRYLIEFTNNADLMADLEFYLLPEGVTPEDLTAAFDALGSEGGMGTPPDWFVELVANGGPSATPGGTGHVVLDLPPGSWVTNLYTYDEATVVNVPFEIEVTGEMPEVTDPEGLTTVTMFEMDFSVEGELASGPQLLRLTSTGEQPHHLILWMVPDGTTEEDVLGLVTTFLGPPASPVASPAATPDPPLGPEDIQDAYGSLVLSSGQQNLVEVDLAPGTYAMVCFIPSFDGVPHVVQGMVEIVVVD